MSRATADPPQASEPPAERDRWLGSDRVVQVRPHIWRWLAPRLDVEPVLEMGPGLRPTVPAARGTFVEVSPHAREVLTRRGGRAIPPDDVPSLPSDAFSAVLAFEVLEHIPEDEEVVRQTARVLKPGGHLVISVPIRQARWTVLDEACGHVRRYEPEDLVDLLERNGLTVQGVRAATGPPRRLAPFRARMMRRHPRGTTSLVQGVFFPAQALLQRTFSPPRWRPRGSRIGDRAEGILLWARKAADRA
jgi:SAM-dependent methyltransferase